MAISWYKIDARYIKIEYDRTTHSTTMVKVEYRPSFSNHEIKAYKQACKQ